MVAPLAFGLTAGEIGGLASGAGSILQGLGVGNKKGPSIYEQVWTQSALGLDHERQAFNQKMLQAKEHGLHPLAMMGIPSSNFSPAVTIGGGSTSFDPGAIGTGIAQAAQGFVKPPEETPDPMKARFDAANLRMLEANAKRAEWEALGTEWKVADYLTPRVLQGQAGNPPAARMSNDTIEMQRLAAEQAGLPPSVFSGNPDITMKQEVLPPHPVKMGHGAMTDQSMVTVMGPDGKPASVLNQKGIQAEFEEGATMTMLVKLFGVDKAVAIMAALEQKGLLAGAGLAGAAAAKGIYNYFTKPQPPIPAYQPDWSRKAPRRGRGGRND